MKALILAAGKGTRMGSMTETVPKPLLTVGSVTLIERQILRLTEGGFTEIVINVAHLGRLIEGRVGDGHRYGARVSYSREGETPLETGGGIRNALPLLGEGPFAVVNADIWTDYDFARLWRIPEEAGHLVLVENPAHNPAGDFVLYTNGCVGTGSGGEGQERLTFSGVAVYRPEVFAGVAERIFPLGPLLSAKADRGEITGEYFDGYWSDVGTPERLAAVRSRAGVNRGGARPPLSP